MNSIKSFDLTPSEDQLLAEAAIFLSRPGVVAKSLSLIGKPVEAAHRSLPGFAKNFVAKASEKAIKQALKFALSSLPARDAVSSPSLARKSARGHQSMASFAGALSGFVGLPLLPLELPFTTVVILRGILDQAKHAGLDLDDPEIRLEALMVFAMSPGVAPSDDAIASYFATRTAFSRLAQKAISYSAAMSARELVSSIDKGTSPILLKLISQVAEKFQIQVSQKILAKGVPVAGAIGGGTINFAFSQFFITAAKYHFGIRALEKKYGNERVQEILQQKVTLTSRLDIY